MSAGEDVDGREPCALLVGMDMDADTVDTSMQVPLKIKNRSAIQPSNLTSGYLPEGNGITTLRDIYAPMFTAALLEEPKHGNNLNVHQCVIG